MDITKAPDWFKYTKNRCASATSPNFSYQSMTEHLNELSSYESDCFKEVHSPVQQLTLPLCKFPIQYAPFLPGLKFNLFTPVQVSTTFQVLTQMEFNGIEIPNTVALVFSRMKIQCLSLMELSPSQEI